MNDARRERRRAAQEAARAARPERPALPPSPGRVRAAWLLGAALTLAGLAAWPDGPLAWLPAVLRWPFVAAAAGAWAWAGGRPGSGVWGPGSAATGAGAGTGTGTGPGQTRTPDSRPQTPDLLLEVAGVALVLGAFLLLKLPGLHASGTDDNIYFYMANRTAQGAVPYRDFFFAHPPFHLLVPAGVFAATGFHIGVAKAIPVLAQATAGLLFYLAARRGGRAFAVTALLFHLTAYQVLMGSTDMNGENLMTLFVAAAVLAAVRGRPALAGALAGLALGCGLYAFAAVVALGTAALFAGRRVGLRFAAGLGACVTAWIVAFAALGGGGFWDGVFLYHLSKPVKGSDRLPVLGTWNPFAMAGALAHNLVSYLGDAAFQKQAYFHAALFGAAGLGAAAVGVRAAGAGWRGDREARRAALTPRDLLSGTPLGFAKLGVLAAALFLAQWAALNETYDFYSVPMLALMAWPAAWAAVRGFQAVRDATRPAALVLPAVGVALFCLHVPATGALNRSLWPDEQREAGREVRYEWRDPVVLAGPAALSRALFFDDSRLKGGWTPPYRHYLWNKMLTFSTADEIGAYVRERTRDDETVTGSSTLAPLVALEAGRRMAGDEADTNAKRFSAGMLTEERFFERVCRDNVRYIVAASRSRFDDKYMDASPTIRRWFRKETTFQDPQLVHFRDYPITLWRRIDEPGLPAGQVCRFEAGER